MHGSFRILRKSLVLQPDVYPAVQCLPISGHAFPVAHPLFLGHLCSQMTVSVILSGHALWN